MKPHLLTILTVPFALACACGASAQHPAASPATASTAAPLPKGLTIKLATVYVDDQDKALHFYTDVLGFAKKDDVSNSGYRWLTVTAPADPDGVQLLLARDNDPAAKAYQQAQFQQHHPAAMFFTGNVKADYERIKARGAEFIMPPTEVTAGSTITLLNDTCGNLIQLTQLAQ